MRKITIAIISTVCLLVSCSKEAGKDIFEVPYVGHTLFEADFEAVDMNGEKSDFIWDKQIGIGVFGTDKGVNEKYTLKKAFDGKAAGEFYGPAVSGNLIRAYYPYTAGLAMYEGELPYRLSSTQSYDPENSLLKHFLEYAGYAYAFTETDKKLRFSYVSGLLAIEVAFIEPVTITSVELRSSDSNIAGMGKVDKDLVVTIGNSGSKNLKVDFGEGLLSKVDDKSTTYPAVLPVGTYVGVRLALNTVEKGQIICELGQFVIERIEAGEYKATELVISPGALGGFEVEGDLEFE